MRRCRPCLKDLTQMQGVAVKFRADPRGRYIEETRSGDVSTQKKKPKCEMFLGSEHQEQILPHFQTPPKIAPHRMCGVNPHPFHISKKLAPPCPCPRSHPPCLPRRLHLGQMSGGHMGFADRGIVPRAISAIYAEVEGRWWETERSSWRAEVGLDH